MVANKWLEALKAKNTIHNTEEDCARESVISLGAGAENAHTPKNPLDKIDKIAEKPKKKAKKLTPEGEYELTLELADEFSGYVISDARARECLEWAEQIDEVEIDIETYGRLKRDGLLYTRCQIRLIILHHAEKMWFIDCKHVSDGMVRRILATLKDTRKIFHNALFDVPRLYRIYGVLLDQDVEDTMIASRVARAGEWERKKGIPLQISHSLDDCIKRELAVEIPKNTKLKWDGLLTEEHLTYAGDDVYHLFDLFVALRGCSRSTVSWIAMKLFETVYLTLSGRPYAGSLSTLISYSPY